MFIPMHHSLRVAQYLHVHADREGWVSSIVMYIFKVYFTRKLDGYEEYENLHTYNEWKAPHARMYTRTQIQM